MQVQTATPLSRRRVLVAGSSWLASSLVMVSHGVATPGLQPTPAQGRGPFYPDVLPLDTDNDLVTIRGDATPAAGQITHIIGRITAVDGRPVRDARVEIWQCNAFGRYIHSRDTGYGQRDPHFQGYGQTTIDHDGWYRFRTIKPVPYPGRAPHIHFAIHGPGFSSLTTQMYVEGAPENAHDFLLNHIHNEAARRSLIVALQPLPDHEPDALSGRFDMVLGND